MYEAYFEPEENAAKGKNRAKAALSYLHWLILVLESCAVQLPSQDDSGQLIIWVF